MAGARKGWNGLVREDRFSASNQSLSLRNDELSLSLPALDRSPTERHKETDDMPKIDKAAAPRGSGTRYPAPFDAPCKARTWLRLGEAAGLTQFGVNLVRLPPGTWSSQRHWHSHEDEFVQVLEGELVLVTEGREETMQAGDSAGFKAGVQDGHCFQNRSSSDAVILVVGTRSDEDHGEYSDIDMAFGAGRYAGKGSYRHKDGTPY